MITVLVLHPQRLVREVWISFLTTRPDIKVVAAAHDLHEAAQMAKYTKPKIALISRELVTAIGIRDLAVIREACPDTLLTLVTRGDPGALQEKLTEMGVRAWLSENSSLNEMETTIRQVNAGFTLPGEPYPSSRRDVHMTAATQLTKREFDILKLLGKGMTSKEIATDLNMSPRTVEVHRYHLLKKMDCKRTTELLHKMSAWAAH